jgi:predicted dehydrogenase
MKFLIAGYGSIGRRHFQNLLSLGEKDILFYRSRKSSLPDETLSGFRVEEDLEKALAQKPDAVIVSNPTALHLDVAIPAARQGCHILLEKPISNSMDRIDELRDAVKVSGSRILVGFQFRYHLGLQKIKELLTERKIGKPLSVRTHWGEYLPNWHPWENYREGYSARADLGGGVILTLCHPFDYLRWLFGEIRSVQAFLGYSGELGLIEVEDTAEINLKFESGVIGSVHLNFNQRPPAHDLEIIGSEGTIYWNGLEGSLKIFQANTGNWKEYFIDGKFERNDLFLSEMKHFIDIIKIEKDPICSLNDGIIVQKLIQNIKLSEREGKAIELLV